MRGFLLFAVVLAAFGWCLLDTIREAEGGTAVASFYGEELRGSPTASGEPFNPDGLTAAHKTLPLGTRLRVCNDSCTSVRINDRGPFTAGRDLDLSKAAAESIGVEGVEEVEIQQTTAEPVTKLPQTGGGIKP